LKLNIFIASLFASLLAACGGSGSSSTGSTTSKLWLSGGHDLQNTRNASTETVLKPDNVHSLAPKWVFTAAGQIPATPAVDEKAVYFPDQAGYLNKVDRSSGALIWRRTICSYTGATCDTAEGYGLHPTSPTSRSTPALSGDRLVIGTRDAYVLAINKETGELLWKTKTDEHPAALITMSPTLYNDHVYVGVSSAEESFVGFPGYKCCSFRGSALDLDLKTGKILWRTYAVPEGYSGAAIWGGPPVIDLKRNQVYFTTGNNYGVPPAVQKCVDAAGEDAVAVTNCIDPKNFFDSVIALDRQTGALKWGRRLQRYDSWVASCGAHFFGVPEFGECPSHSQLDYDFASGVNLFSTSVQGAPRDIVGVGQKSGIYWALDPNDGDVIWATQVGPGGMLGGIQWGSSTDGERIYVGLSNSHGQPYELKTTGKTITQGAWNALDPGTGRILWQTPNPSQTKGWPVGFVSSANGVVYAGSFDPAGHMYAFDAKTGSILWDFESGGSVISGAAIVDGEVYWGSGFTLGPHGTTNNKLYAFSLPKH